MEQLNYAKGMTLNFNLRKPLSKRPTNLYAVVNACGKQIKIPTTAKINAYMWDKKKQLPMMFDGMSEGERDNAKQVLSIILSFQSAFSDYYCYICQNFRIFSQKDVRDYFEKTVLSELIVKKMAKNGVLNVRRERKATKALLEAIELYSKQQVTASTIKTYRYNLQNFLDYCNAIPRDSIRMLTDDGMKEFESYLRKQKKSADNIRNCIRVVKTLTNKVIAKNDKFKSYGVKPISYKLPENISTKGKKVELTDEEIEAIRTCEGLTPKQVEYRDLFMLEILTGQRASDIHILFDSSLFTVRRGYFCFITKKEKVPAKVKQTPEILEIINRYKDGFKYIDINSGSLVQNESTCLKLIGRKAGLNRIIEYVDNEGIKQSKPLCDLLSSHYGRHTFVTKMARIITLEEVKYLTGHKDTQSLTKNYLHQTEDDVIDILENAFADKSNSSNPIVVKNDALNVIFAYDSFISIIELMNKNNDVFHLDSTKQAIKVMKDISKLNSYSKDANVSKVQELEQVIFELSYYFRDTLLYSVYKHKESYFGMQVEVPSTQDVEIMFAQEDLERPQKQIQADIEAWENR